MTVVYYLGRQYQKVSGAELIVNAPGGRSLAKVPKDEEDASQGNLPTG